jgi:hypothetical protein
MNVVKDIDESIAASYRYDIFGKPLKNLTSRTGFQQRDMMRRRGTVIMATGSIIQNLADG